MQGTKRQHCCPHCGKSDHIYFMDRGFKFLWRFLHDSNRFACGKCKITWREGDKYDLGELAGQKKRK